MNVALCDDDAIFLTSLKKRLSAYDCNIYAFKTVKELISYELVFDIAFLDIELEENTTGFQAIRDLRMRNKKCIIALFTNHEQYAIKGYDYRAFSYILKNEPDRIINRRINEVFKEYSRIHKSFSGSYNGYSFNVALDDILYISSDNHILSIHTDTNVFEIYKQMKDVEKEFGEFGFLRCHKSYIVNMKNIVIMRSDYYFILSDKSHTAIPIGITFRKKAEESYLNHVVIGG